MEGKPKLEKHQRDRRMSPALLQALNSARRRQILRALHSHGQNRSPAELVEETSIPLAQLSYHARTLRELGATSEKLGTGRRGVAKHFYRSVVADNDYVRVILAETEGDDARKLGLKQASQL